jgi:short subunit fatty acids transporter
VTWIIWTVGLVVGALLARREWRAGATMAADYLARREARR